MPRRPTPVSIDALVQDAVEEVVEHASAAIARLIADRAAARIGAELEQRAGKAGRGRRAAAGGRARARGEITRWVADRRARRVPTFVIDLTGLETKRQIVAKYGDGAAFEKGKAAPRAR